MKLQRTLSLFLISISCSNIPISHAFLLSPSSSSPSYLQTCQTEVFIRNVKVNSAQPMPRLESCFNYLDGNRRRQIRKNKSLYRRSHRSMLSKDVPEDVLNASILPPNNLDGVSSEDNGDDETNVIAHSSNRNERKRDRLRNFVKKIASLSLQDYKWRSEVFKNNEADALMEKSLARMRGEDMAYVRPMDASDEQIGPLGVAEKKAVQWLSNVIEEEGNRAKSIVEGDGNFIRPMDSAKSSNFEGPLASLERTAVDFFKRIVDSETERAVQGRLRPMELEESKRGPLGIAEQRAVEAFETINESEKLRLEQSRARGGDVVRPIDVPGPLGEIERTALELVQAEKQRLKEKENLGRFVRPKDASIEGPLGKAEREAVEAFDLVKLEEEKRLKSIQRVLMEKRPMENNRESAMGIAESLVVGVLRAPQLLLVVIDRVKELLQSENLMGNDEKLKLTESSNENKKSADDDDTVAKMKR